VEGVGCVGRLSHRAAERHPYRLFTKSPFFKINPRAAKQQQLNGVHVPAVSGPMQAGLSVMLELRVHIYTFLQQEIDDAGSAEFTGPGESVLQLFLRRSRLQAAVVVKEAFDGVEATDSGRSFQVQARAVARKEFGRLPTPVMQAAVDRAASIGTVDYCAMVDQQFHQRDLHAGLFRMPARRRQSEGCRTSAIRV